MTIPDFQTIMLPFLKFAGDGQEYAKHEVVDKLAQDFKLSESELKELLPSGKQELFDNRVGWTRTYLKKAGLIDTARRGYFRITERGKEVLKQNPSKIDVKFLNQYPEFKEFHTYKNNKSEIISSKEDEERTPQERLYNAYEQINEEIARDILQQLKTVSPKSFEHIVVDLMVAMGYGGNFNDAVKSLGKVGDEGVDGVINQDSLGINQVYLQAKRYTDKSVGHPEIRDFIGALDFKHAACGIFITTSDFTQDVKDHVDRSTKKIILISGNKLANLMIAHNVGVTVEETVAIKKIDLDYFIEE